MPDNLQELKDEQFGLHARAYECDQLIDFIETGVHQLDLSTDMSVVADSALRIVSKAVTHRIQEIDDIIEAKTNQTMDRYRRRQIL